MPLSDVIANSFDYLKDLPQRYDWHPEGDVGSHSAYVTHSLRQWTEDGSREQREMMLVAAFHDIGKIPTTKRKNGDGYIVSYGHAKKSVRYWNAVCTILCDDTDLRSNVIRWLIKEHMNMKFLNRMNDSTIEKKKKEAKKLGNDVWEMAMKFPQADDMLAFFDRHDLDYIEPIDPAEEVPVIDRHEEAIGRFRNYTENIIEKIEDFEDKNDQDLGDFEYENKDLILVRGVPGSGKSTFAEMLLRNTDQMIATDDFFYEDGEYKFDKSKLGEAHQWCQNQVEKMMKDGTGVPRIIIHNTFVSTWETLPYYRMAAENGYEVHSIVKENQHGGESIHGVPNSTCERMSKDFQINLY